MSCWRWFTTSASLALLVCASTSAMAQGGYTYGGQYVSATNATENVSLADAAACGGCDSCGQCSSCNACCSHDCIIGQSDHCFDCFISPITNPVYFEDPRALTEIRPIYVHHRVPTAAGGGNIDVVAAQIRAAFNENVSLIAVKDGYLTSTNPLIDDGWADVSLGLKFTLLRDPEEQKILSAGLVFQLPVGSTRSLQGRGNGEFDIFASYGTQVGDNWHWISTTGFRLPSDPGDNSSVWYWSNHLDVQVTDRIYLLSELNWYHWMSSGAGGIPGVEGVDFFNFGSTNVAGNNVATLAFGTKYKPSGNLEIGLAYEFPITERKDVFEDRLTVDVIFRY